MCNTRRLVVFLVIVCLLPLTIVRIMRESYLDVPSQYSLFRDIISNDSFQSLTLKQLLKCNDRPLLMKRFRRGKYWIMENVVVGRKSRHMGCADSITFTTHGDYSFVDSLETLVGRWLAPISLAIFAPGHDIIATLEAIQYVRNCVPKSDLVSDFVTFHIYFPYRHMPEYVPLNETEALEYPYSCAATDIIFGKPSNMNRPREEMYRLQKNLSYPINVGRNIARTAANTHFIFACDLQLFPSLGFVDQFLDMVDRNHSILLLDPKTQQPRVYPVPVFELRKNESLPNNKTELLEQYKRKGAQIFKLNLCEICHRVPDQKRWLRRNPNLTDELQVFSVSTRTGKFRSWEPFYVSDNAEPLFDEKVSWEGQSSKRVQGYAMCLLGYEYHVLHPAFLVHTPGFNEQLWRNSSQFQHTRRMNKYINQKIIPEYLKFYGRNEKCAI